MRVRHGGGFCPILGEVRTPEERRRLVGRKKEPPRADKRGLPMWFLDRTDEYDDVEGWDMGIAAVVVAANAEEARLIAGQHAQDEGSYGWQGVPCRKIAPTSNYKRPRLILMQTKDG